MTKVAAAAAETSAKALSPLNTRSRTWLLVDQQDDSQVEINTPSTGLQPPGWANKRKRGKSAGAKAASKGRSSSGGGEGLPEGMFIFMYVVVTQVLHAAYLIQVVYSTISAPSITDLSIDFSIFLHCLSHSI